MSTTHDQEPLTPQLPDPSESTGSAPRRSSRKLIATTTAGAVLVGGLGFGIAKATAGSSHSRAPQATTQETNTPSPSATNTITQSPTYSPTEIPTIAPTEAGPSSGNINLVTLLPTDRTDTVPLPQNAGEVKLPYLRDPSEVTPAQFADSFLANFAYYMMTDNEQNAQYILSTITDDSGVASYLESTRTATQTMSNPPRQELVEFWDSADNPAVFEQGTNQYGQTVIKLAGGQLNLTDIAIGDPAHPGTKIEWQTGQNHDPLHTARITDLELAWHNTEGDPTGSVKIDWINLQLQKPS
jgi:hypothetical protein